MKNICIIGCGYIGSEVALRWTKKGHQVTATTRHMKRLDSLSKIAKKSLIFKGTSEEELIPLISTNEVILVTIAPDSPEQYGSTYLQTANMFRHLALEMNEPRYLIYTSSTSVYGDHHGLWVDETSSVLGKSEQARILIETEKLYQSLEEIGWNVCILRLSEIYGPGREVSKRIRQLEGHVMPGTGELFTNMIHKEDIANAIDYALKHDFEGIYNLADDDHMTRKDLYLAVAKKQRLPEVKWDPSHPGLHSDNKRVSNHKIKSEGFSLHYPHRLLD